MGYYKIKNITNLLGKRHLSKNTTLDVEYSSGYKKESFLLNVGGIAYFEAGNLPFNIHKLRMKNMITVVEVSKNEFYKKQKPVVAKPVTPAPLLADTLVSVVPMAEPAKVVEVQPTVPENSIEKKPKKRVHIKKETSTVISTPDELNL